MTIREILDSDNKIAKKALFAFNETDSIEAIVFKFNLWSRHFFPKYFSSKDAEFHHTIDICNVKAYGGDLNAFINIAFRGAAKTARTKLFVAFCILNDMTHYRRYYKVLAEDGNNSKQIVTDIYNMLVNPRVVDLYPETFEKTNAKREEQMGSFTTSTGIKVLADTVGNDQRGAIQEDARPDFIWYEDFENRTTLRSAKKTKTIWENMEEARTGLAKGGACVYTCNYLSEQGNVHLLVTKQMTNKFVLIVPIKDSKGNSMWPSRYTLHDIASMEKDDDDFDGERMCKPNASKDIYFDRETLDKMEAKPVLKEVGGFKVFKKYDPAHRYGGGHDVAGGVGLDSSASVFIDFDTVPAQVVGTFHDNTIKPEAFGNEVYREGNHFGGCILGIENNKFDQTILKAKLLGANLFKTRTNEMKVGGTPTYNYGWNTNALTKPKMLASFAKAVEDGLIELNDPDLIAEAKAYTRNDLIDTVRDPRMSTRHFDLLTAACIAWQMKDHATVSEPENDEDTTEEEPQFADIGV